MWIEISHEKPYDEFTARSPSVRKVWIEISNWITYSGDISSPSVRKVWIEILEEMALGQHQRVTFRKEGVD